MDKFKEIATTFERVSVKNFKKGLIVNMLKGIIKKKLENVRPDQLYTHIVQWKPSSAVLAEKGRILPEGTENTIKSLNRFIDIKKELNKVEPMIDQQCGFIVMESIKKTRPDLYKVIARTPGGQSMVWSDAREMWEEIKKEIEDVC